MAFKVLDADQRGVILATMKRPFSRENRFGAAVLVAVVVLAVLVVIHVNFSTWGNKYTSRPESGPDVVCARIANSIMNSLHEKVDKPQNDSVFVLDESNEYWELCALYDRGKPYMVAIDWDGDGALKLSPNHSMDTKPGGVFVWSAGKDGDYWTFEDNRVSGSYTTTVPTVIGH